MLNSVTLIGRLCGKPEIRYTKDSTAVANFCLAVDNRFNDDTTFVDIVVWRQQAENCAKYLDKGKLCAVEGSLSIRSYQAKDGTKRKVAEVVADQVVFLSPKDSKPEEVEAEPYYADEQSELPF